MINLEYLFIRSVHVIIILNKNCRVKKVKYSTFLTDYARSDSLHFPYYSDDIAWMNRGGQQEIELMPFHTFTTMTYNNEAARTLLMNVVLFLLFGLTIPYVMEGIKGNRRRWIYCLLIGCGISVGIEALQYCHAIGLAETDDVICNTLGCGLGILADVIGRKIERNLI